MGPAQDVIPIRDRHKQIPLGNALDLGGDSKWPRIDPVSNSSASAECTIWYFLGFLDFVWRLTGKLLLPDKKL